MSRTTSSWPTMSLRSSVSTCAAAIAKASGDIAVPLTVPAAVRCGAVGWAATCASGEVRAVYAAGPACTWT